MKIRLIIAIFLIFSILLPAANARAAEKGKVLRHVVMFKFSENTTPATIQKIEASFAALTHQISEIKGFEWGTNSSPEGLNQGLTHCFILTFTSDKDRNAYLIHPAHKAFGASLGKDVEKVTVVDFWVK
jgi:Stress responsive A/B Barrel Domain